MIMRAVKIDEVVAETLERGEGGGAAVDELPVGPGSGEDALDEKLALLARLDPLRLQLGIQRGGLTDIEAGLDGATVGSGAEEGLVGAVAEDELEGAHDDRFSGAGLARDGDKAGRNRPGEVFDQCEIPDAK